jgi:hypothetical protein
MQHEHTVVRRPTVARFTSVLEAERPGWMSAQKTPPPGRQTLTGAWRRLRMMQRVAPDTTSTTHQRATRGAVLGHSRR